MRYESENEQFINAVVVGSALVAAIVVLFLAL